MDGIAVICWRLRLEFPEGQGLRSSLNLGEMGPGGISERMKYSRARPLAQPAYVCLAVLGFKILFRRSHTEPGSSQSGLVPAGYRDGNNSICKKHEIRNAKDTCLIAMRGRNCELKGDPRKNLISVAAEVGIVSRY